MKLPKIGPGILITAAFIGPGTVITASVAGANYGFVLLWALLFSVFATMILQEMAARLGLATGKGLGENIRNSLSHPFARNIGVLLVVSAIVVGNAAYQGGNLAGASLGMDGLFGHLLFENFWSLLFGLIAFLLLWTGKYKVIERMLFALVALMSIAFISTLVITKPDLIQLFSGLLTPSIPAGATLTVIALIGTTVVPYNLFLHSSSVLQKWKSIEYLTDARSDLYFSISLGGLVSLAILSTAASAFFGSQVEMNSAADLAPSLAPVFGQYAEVLMALGLLAAGLSSAITAPLAAGFALSGILKLDREDSKKTDINNLKFKGIWGAILLLGIITATAGFKPISIIWFAQVANGILLPLVVIFLLWIMNSERLAEYKNSLFQNMLGFSVLIVTLILSGRSLMSAFGFL